MTTNTTINYAKLADDAADTYTSARDALNRAMLHDLISRSNGAYSCVEHVLKEVVLNGGKGSAEATARNVNGATMEVDDTLSKKELTPLASFAQDLLATTGCTLDVSITQVYESGPYTVSHVVTHTIHPSVEKRHRTLKVSVLTPPTLGLEG